MCVNLHHYALEHTRCPVDSRDSAEDVQRYFLGWNSKKTARDKRGTAFRWVDAQSSVRVRIYLLVLV
jgi:hypothetical protein